MLAGTLYRIQLKAARCWGQRCLAPPTQCPDSKLCTGSLTEPEAGPAPGPLAELHGESRTCMACAVQGCTWRPLQQVQGAA